MPSDYTVHEVASTLRIPVEKAADIARRLGMSDGTIDMSACVRLRNNDVLVERRMSRLQEEREQAERHAARRQAEQQRAFDEEMAYYQALEKLRQEQAQKLEQAEKERERRCKADQKAKTELGRGVVKKY